MIFTQEQINEIKQRLALSGSKDLQLPLANLPLSGEETIALVQQGENKRVSIEEFYEEFSQYIDGDEFAESDYGLVVDNSNGLQDLNQKLDMLAQAALQNQTISFSTIMKLYGS